MIPWFKGTIKIQQYAESGKFIILEVTHHKGKLYKVIEQANPEDYKVRFAGSLKKCADWANSHGANFLIYGICGGRYSYVDDRIYKDTDSVKLPESCPEVAPELPQICQNCKWFLPGAKKCQLKDNKIIGDPACIGCGLYESED